jgi:hypothetical protein
MSVILCNTYPEFHLRRVPNSSTCTLFSSPATVNLSLNNSKYITQTSTAEKDLKMALEGQLKSIPNGMFLYLCSISDFFHRNHTSGTASVCEEASNSLSEENLTEQGKQINLSAY